MTPDLEAAGMRWLAARGFDGENSDDPDGGDDPRCDSDDPREWDRDSLDDR